MTVASTTRRIEYTGTGTTGPFSYNFKIFADSELVVTKHTIASGSETVLTLTTDYTVTGAGVEAGGTITTTTAVTSAFKLIIERILPLTQTYDYVEGDEFPAATHETALDRMVMIAQQQQAKIDRSLVQGTSATTTLTLPVPTADKYLKATSATALEWDDVTVTTTAYSGTISHGADASKPATPGVGDIYVATDTYLIYLCYTANTWTKYETSINTQTADTATSGSDVFLFEDSGASYAKKKITFTNLQTSLLTNKVKASATDATANYLDGKVDGTSVTVTSDKLALVTAVHNQLKSKMCKTLPEPSSSISASACIMENGRLMVWGDEAKIGVGTGSGDRWVPALAGLANSIGTITKVYLTHSNIYCIDSNGYVYGSGANGSSQLGDGGTTASSVFKRIGTLSGVSKLAVGTDGLTAGVCVYALTAAGALWGWGVNGAGQVGDNTTTDVTTPFQISGTWLDVATAGSTSGYAHTVAVKSDGTVWSCGYNNVGQLGLGDTVDRDQFEQMTGGTIAAKTATKCWCSGDGATSSAYVLADDGTLHACGDNSFGQLCDGTTTDRNVTVACGVSTVSNLYVSGGSDVWCCAIYTDGSVRTWGANVYGALGNGNTTNQSSAQNPSLTGITKAVCFGTATYGCTALLKSDGTIYCAGYNVQGNLGIGNVTSTSTFTQPYGIPIAYVSDISSVNYSAYAQLMVKLTDGNLLMTGYNAAGELGVGNTTLSVCLTPVKF